jgi:hypothetical protein
LDRHCIRKKPLWGLLIEEKSKKKRERERRWEGEQRTGHDDWQNVLCLHPSNLVCFSAWSHSQLVFPCFLGRYVSSCQGKSLPDLADDNLSHRSIVLSSTVCWPDGEELAKDPKTPKVQDGRRLSPWKTVEQKLIPSPWWDII